MKTHPINLFRRAGFAAVLFAAVFVIPAVRAQPTEQTVQSRFLFIFDTSSDMKARVAATQKALNMMLATSLSGQLHAGDSMGVWTFNQNLNTRGHPLQSWNPDDAAMIASNLTKFASNQHYAKSTRFEALQPLLNQVVQDSERLTVLIFCDGDGKINGTPFDDAINQMFQEKKSAQKKAREPLVILLRSQLGQYVGCTVSLPPLPVNIPQFPPLPVPPPPPAPKPEEIPPTTPVIVSPPLIIIGTNVGNSLPPVPSPASASIQTNRYVPPVVPAPAVPVTNTNTPVPPTNPAVTRIIGIAPTNTPATAQNSDTASKGFLLIGAGLFGAAIALGIVVWLSSRRKVPSLITRSMNDRK